MIQQGVPVSRDVAYFLLQECTRKKDLAGGRRARSLMVISKLDSISVLGDFLIRLFASCGSLQEANEVFCVILKPSLYTWNSIILAHARLGHGFIAVEFYQKMVEKDVDPDAITFSCILKATINAEALEDGLVFHHIIITKRFDGDVVVGSTLVDMYGKWGKIPEACRVFDLLSSKNLVSWSAMISAYTRGGLDLCALELFVKMQKAGVMPDSIVLSCVLKAIGNMKAIDQGQCILDQVARSELIPDTALGNAVIDMYVKCGDMPKARRTFDNLPIKSIVSWGAMMTGYAESGQAFSALQLFMKMQEEGGSPDRVIFLAGLKACSDLGSLHRVRWLHDRLVRNNLNLDVIIGSTLVDVYAKCGSLEESKVVFDILPSRNVVAWSGLIAGHVQHEHGLMALDFYKQMQHEDIPPDKSLFLDVLKACARVGALGQVRIVHSEFIRDDLHDDLMTGCTLIDAYAKCGSLKEAHKVFDALPTRDSASWGALIIGYGRAGNCTLAEECFTDMQAHGLKPDSVIFSSILSAYRHAGLLEEGRQYFKHMQESHHIMPNLEQFSCMIDLLARIGRLNEAEGMVQTMPLFPDNAVWMSLLTGCKAHNSLQLGRWSFDHAAELAPVSTPG